MYNVLDIFYGVGLRRQVGYSTVTENIGALVSIVQVIEEYSSF